MRRTTYVNPIEELHGKLNTPKEHDGAIFICRRKCYGVTKKGQKILGPRESYAMHRHEGAWSQGATENRKRFAQSLNQAYAELQDPERKAYWQALFEEQFEHPKSGQKRYVRLQSFVAAKISEQQNN